MAITSLIFPYSKELVDSIKDKFGKNPNFIFEYDVIPSEYFHNSICMISDWSGISMEYAFTCECSVIFIDVPKKILNPDVNNLSLEPIEISLRNKIGYVVSPENIENIPDIIKNFEKDIPNFSQRIKEIRTNIVFNVGNAAQVGAKYIQNLIS